jgi:hypothetical protein
MNLYLFSLELNTRNKELDLANVSWNKKNWCTDIRITTLRRLDKSRNRPNRERNWQIRRLITNTAGLGRRAQRKIREAWINQE